MAAISNGNKSQDGDGYFAEEMKVDVGDFSLDSLDLDDEEANDDKSEGVEKDPKKVKKDSN